MSVDALTLDFHVAAGDFSLDVDENLLLEGITAVFGPSGSGKSTLLRAVAGFATPERGRIACGNETWFESSNGTDLPPHRRAAGFMFQETCLFPHLDVAGNLAFAERRSRRPHQVQRADIVATLDLESLLHRNVQSLSGGERQRAALARTLLTGPRLLLLDEPLAALDRDRKAEIIPYLEKLPRQFHIPTLYVSHDIDEIAELADHALVLTGGRVQFHGPIVEAIERLDLQTLAGRFDTGVLVTGKVIRHDSDLRVSFLDLNGETLTMPIVPGLSTGETVRLRVRARDVAIAISEPKGISIRNVLAGTLIALRDDADSGFVDALVETRGSRVRARLTRAAVKDLSLVEGMPVYALIKSVSFDRGH